MGIKLRQATINGEKYLIVLFIQMNRIIYNNFLNQVWIASTETLPIADHLVPPEYHLASEKQ